MVNMETNNLIFWLCILFYTSIATLFLIDYRDNFSLKPTSTCRISQRLDKIVFENKNETNIIWFVWKLWQLWQL